jgi:hypothetical protein
MNNIDASDFDENPIISHENMDIKLIHKSVDFLPIFSIKYPETKPPKGLDNPVTEANHDAWSAVNLTSKLCSLSKGNVDAG